MPSRAHAATMRSRCSSGDSPSRCWLTRTVPMARRAGVLGLGIVQILSRVDTPESVKPGTPVQCYAKRAAAANAALVAGRSVRLVGDVERRDRYGRLLAYVYREPDGAFVNAQLVRDGYARTLAIAPNVAHAHQFAQLAQLARRSGRGLWRACGMG